MAEKKAISRLHLQRATRKSVMQLSSDLHYSDVCVYVWPPFLQLAATNIQGKCQFLCCICSLKHQSKPTQLQSNAIAKIFTHFERPTIENPSRPSSSDVSLIGTGVRPCLPPGLGSAVAASRIFF